LLENTAEDLVGKLRDADHTVPRGFEVGELVFAFFELVSESHELLLRNFNLGVVLSDISHASTHYQRRGFDDDTFW